ncbi:MAG TPA: alpha/beta fold hydrolase [Chloroflexota bacterium]
MPLDVEILDVRGIPVHYQRTGQGQPLLYLHGSGAALQWDAGLTALADRFDVIAPAHPGFGPYERPEWMDTIADYAFHYLDFMDALGLDCVHLMGTSMGGWMAAELAVCSSQRLTSLTLIDAAGLQVEGAPAPNVFAMTREEQTRLVFHDQTLADQALAVDLDEAALAAYRHNVAIMELLARDPYLHDPKLPHRLHRVSTPTLVVWGAQDRLIPPAHGRAYAEAIPRARLTLIPDCGHIPHQERPDEFLAIVQGFLPWA